MKNYAAWRIYTADELGLELAVYAAACEVHGIYPGNEDCGVGIGSNQYLVKKLLFVVLKIKRRFVATFLVV